MNGVRLEKFDINVPFNALFTAFTNVPGQDDGGFFLVMSTVDGRLCRLDFDLDRCTARINWARDTPSRSWFLQCHGPFHRGDIFSAGSGNVNLVYTGREDGHLHAYDVADGTPAWSHEFSGTVSEFMAYRDPFIGTPLLLVPSLDRTLRLLDAARGTLLWGDTFASGVNCCAVEGIATNLVDACQGGNRQPEQGGISNHHLAAGGNDFTLRVYCRDKDDPLSGYRMSWHSKFGSYVRCIDIGARTGLVAAVGDDGFLNVYHLDTGDITWRHEYDSFAWKCKILEGEGIVVASTYQVPVEAGEGGATLGNPGRVSCHDLETGETRWMTGPEDGLNVNSWEFFHAKGGSPLVACGTTDGRLVLMDIDNGKLVSEVRVGGLVDQVGIHWNGEKPALIVAIVENDKAPLQVLSLQD